MKLKEAIKALDDLPTTAAIADELVSLGIKAEPRLISQCALAEYFMLVTESYYAAVAIDMRLGGEVAGGWVSTQELLPTGLRPASFALSAKLGRFAAEFDRGDYPKLVVESCTS